MDKEKSKKDAQIKIKLNGVESPFIEETPIYDWQSASSKESAATSEERVEDDEFDWVLPHTEEKEVPEFKIVDATVSNFRKNSSRKWRKNLKPGLMGLLFSTFLAVLVGLVLGIVFWKMMNQTDDPPIALNEVTTPAATVEEKSGVVQETLAAKLPTMTVPIIQAGAFSTKEAADTAAIDIQKESLPSSIILIDDMYYLFVGVAGDLENAKSWSSSLTEKGMVVWAKELTIDEKNIQLSSKDEEEQLSAEAKLFSSLTGEALSAQLDSTINDTVLKEAMTILNSEKSKSLKNKSVQELHSELNSANKSLLEYQKTSDAKELRNAQQALLNYVTIYFNASN